METAAERKPAMEYGLREIAPTLGMMAAGDRCSSDSELGIRTSTTVGATDSRQILDL